MRLRQRTVRPLVLAKRLRRVRLERCWLEQTESLNSGAAVEQTQRRGKLVGPLVQTARPLLRLHWKAWPQQTDSSEKPMTAEPMELSMARQQQRVRLGQLRAMPERRCGCLRSRRTVSPPAVPPSVGPVGRPDPEKGPDKLGKFQIPARMAARCAGRFPKEQAVMSKAAQATQIPRARVRGGAGESHRRRLGACWWVPQRPCQTETDRWGH